MSIERPKEMPPSGWTTTDGFSSSLSSERTLVTGKDSGADSLSGSLQILQQTNEIQRKARTKTLQPIIEHVD